ncbi:hypothetical protein [Pleionea sediminis]|uniref:hypothetical protein n=1 Tax=Pleionea sediminis TaxID=2569479 RepID=UPI0011867AB5|nr:hypothetical protein [Pleionea sediminis]
MHKRDRIVPKKEKLLHAIILPLMAGFIISVYLGYHKIAFTHLIISFPLMIIDEFIYHKNLHPKEVKVHRLAGIALTVFIGYWLWTI